MGRVGLILLWRLYFKRAVLHDWQHSDAVVSTDTTSKEGRISWTLVHLAFSVGPFNLAVLVLPIEIRIEIQSVTMVL